MQPPSSGQATRVVRAVEQLPHACRQVLVLHHLAGLALADVAAQVRRDPAQVARELVQAHRLLAAALHADEPPGLRRGGCGPRAQARATVVATAGGRDDGSDGRLRGLPAAG